MNIMNQIIINTIFDIENNNTFSVKDSNFNTVGTLKINDGNISIVNTDNSVTKFKNAEEFQKFVNNNTYYFGKELKDGERWIKYNPNPKHRNTGDCTIRAYTKAFGISWDEAYEIASRYGKDYGALPNDAKVVDKILTEEFGCTIKRFPKSGDRNTVEEFAATHPKGTFIAKVHGHVVAVVDGKYYDSWNSGSKKIMAIYTVE